jgi:hypothetical protein
VAALLLSCAAAIPALAQNPNGRPRRPREEAFRMIEAYVVSNM